MYRDEAKEILLSITEIFDYGNLTCSDCPFHNIIEGASCPFNECAEYWGLAEDDNGNS